MTHTALKCGGYDMKEETKLEQEQRMKKRQEIYNSVGFMDWKSRKTNDNNQPHFVVVNDFGMIMPDKQEWCENNLSGRFLPLDCMIFKEEYGLDKVDPKALNALIMYTIWIFENEIDATAFKLRWL